MNRIPLLIFVVLLTGCAFIQPIPVTPQVTTMFYGITNDVAMGWDNQFLWIVDTVNCEGLTIVLEAKANPTDSSWTAETNFVFNGAMEIDYMPLFPSGVEQARIQ